MELVRRLACVVVVGMTFASGCGSLDLDDSEPSPAPAPSPEAAGYGGIPRGATRVAQGFGTVVYRAEQAGRIWVGNDTERFLVTETRVRRGEDVLVEPREDRVSVNGQVVFDRNLEKNHQHSIFFTLDGAGDGAGSGDAYGAIPERARRLAEGYGRVRVKAPAQGRVWIGNDTDRFEVVSFNVAAGDDIEVDASKDRVWLNGKEMFSQNLESKHKHVVFYKESLGSAGYGKIPGDAERVASGTGTVRFRIERDGFAWVGDDESRRELLLNPVNRGDFIEVDPGALQHEPSAQRPGRVALVADVERRPGHDTEPSGQRRRIVVRLKRPSRTQSSRAMKKWSLSGMKNIHRTGSPSGVSRHSSSY